MAAQTRSSLRVIPATNREADEGFAVSVPGLPGCHSQGDTETEALANSAEAIRVYLDVVQELAQATGAKQAEVEE